MSLSPATAPPHFYTWGGKPLGGNPSSTVWKPSSHRVNPNDSECSLTKVMHFLHSLSHGRNRLSVVGVLRVLKCCLGLGYP